MERIWILLTGLLMLFSPGKSQGRSLCCRSSGGTDAYGYDGQTTGPFVGNLTGTGKANRNLFSYESSLLDEFPKISFKAQDESLSYCLRRLFSTLPLTYRQTGQIVILKRKPRLYTISGFVRDSVSYESLINANVFERKSRTGTTTNNYGFYSITLPPGKVTLRASLCRIRSERGYI